MLRQVGRLLVLILCKYSVLEFILEIRVELIVVNSVGQIVQTMPIVVSVVGFSKIAIAVDVVKVV